MRVLTVLLALNLATPLVGCTGKRIWQRPNAEPFTKAEFFGDAFRCKHVNSYLAQRSGSTSFADTNYAGRVAFSHSYLTYDREQFIDCMRGLRWEVSSQ